MNLSLRAQLLVIVAFTVVLSGCETVDTALRSAFDGVFGDSEDVDTSSTPGTRIRSTTPSQPDLETLLEAGPSAVELTGEELRLYELIMEYRQDQGLPPIPLSRSLTFLAQVHARDTARTNFPAGCNRHSWSDDGPWSGGCYTSDHANAELMWEKPRELTDYPGSGFEISHYHSGGATPMSSLSGWQSSPGHDRVIRNAGQWSQHPWNAIGIGIYRTEAHVWFGREPDPMAPLE